MSQTYCCDSSVGCDDKPVNPLGEGHPSFEAINKILNLNQGQKCSIYLTSVIENYFNTPDKLNSNKLYLALILESRARFDPSSCPFTRSDFENHISSCVLAIESW
jgi:hypothetical protein